MLVPLSLRRYPVDAVARRVVFALVTNR